MYVHGFLYNILSTILQIQESLEDISNKAKTEKNQTVIMYYVTGATNYSAIAMRRNFLFSSNRFT